MKVKSHSLIAISIAIGLPLLSGCTGLSPDRYLANKRTFMLKQGDSPAYVSGYVDGCSSGRRLGGDRHFVYRKNAVQFERDALYARGWQEGQINCRNEALAQDGVLVDANQRDIANGANGNEAHHTVQSEKDRIAEEEMRQMWEELKK